MGPGDLRSLPEDERVFVDSNILTYYLLNDTVYGEESTKFIDSIEEGRYYGFLSALVVSEVLFNMIKAWVADKYGVRPKDAASMIKRRPEILCEIPIDEAFELFDIFYVLPLGEAEVKESYRMITEHCLLTNDALNAAAMKVNRITQMATNDRDFFNIDWMKCWVP
jgi:predicted nucleic acid-binding protein